MLELIFSLVFLQYCVYNPWYLAIIISAWMMKWCIRNFEIYIKKMEKSLQPVEKSQRKKK